MDWTALAQNRDKWRALENTIMNLRVPHDVGKFLSGYTAGTISRRAQLHEVSQLGPQAPNGMMFGGQLILKDAE
jgi:hypothetical protein